MLRVKKAGLLLKLLALVLMAYMIFMLVGVQQKISTAKTDIKDLHQQVVSQTQTNTALSNAIENRDDPSFLEDIARERLNLVSPNDRVFYISD